MTEHVVKLRDIDVKVTVHGQGAPAVVLFAGGGITTHNCYPDLVEGLAGHTVVVHDRPGTGTSPVDASITMAEAAKEAVRLLDALGLDRAVFVGHSLGGALVIQLLADHADRVAGALMLDPTPLNDVKSCDKATSIFKTVQSIVGLPLVGSAIAGLLVRVSRPRRMGASARRCYDASFAGDWIGDTARSVETLPADARAFSARTITAPGVPAILVAADRKPKHRVAQHHRELAQMLGARLEVWPRTGHSVHLQRPDLVIERTRELLAEART